MEQAKMTTQERRACVLRLFYAGLDTWGIASFMAIPESVAYSDLLVARSEARLARQGSTERDLQTS